MVHQLVLGLKGLALPGTFLPRARVRGHLRAADVLDCQVGDDLVHGGEGLVARFAGLGHVLVDPETRVLLFDGRPHVAEEGARPVGTHVHVVHGGVHVRVHMTHVHVVHVRRGVVEVVDGRARTRHLVVLVAVGPAVHVGARQTQPHLAVHVRRRRARVMSVVEPREENVRRRAVRVVRGGVEPRRRRHEHGGVRRPRLRVGQPRHVVAPQEEVARGVRVVRGVRHGGVGVGLRPVLLLGVGGTRVSHPVGRGQLETSVPQVRRVRRVHEGIQHHGEFVLNFSTTK